jgi:hypothetical protein
MSTVMRAKMFVERVESYGYPEGKTFKQVDKVTMKAVCSDGFGPNGESEDNTFARFTPQGETTLTITNPDLTGKIKPGQRFYLDFTPAE